VSFDPQLGQRGSGKPLGRSALTSLLLAASAFFSCISVNGFCNPDIACVTRPNLYLSILPMNTSIAVLSLLVFFAVELVGAIFGPGHAPYAREMNTNVHFSMGVAAFFVPMSVLCTSLTNLFDGHA